MAYKALKIGKNVPMEPMNPYERRIIHTAVQKVNGVISWSEGENIDRHVVIGLDPNAKTYRRRNSGYNKSRSTQKKHYNDGYNRNGNRNGYTAGHGQNNQVQKRAPINDGGNFSLYGKIEMKKEKESI